LSGDRELDALAGLKLGLDEGTNGVDGEEHEEGENETVEEVEAGVSQLITNGFDGHIGDGSRVKVDELGDTTGLVPLLGRVDDSVLKQMFSHWNGEHMNNEFETNLEAVDELSEGDITTVTKYAQSLELVGVSTILELDTDKVPLVRRGTGTDFDSDGRSVIGQTLKLRIVLRNLSHVEERDHGLIRGFNEQDLQGVRIEGNALQSGEDGVHGGTTSDCEEELETRKFFRGASHVLLPIPPMSLSEKTLSSCQLTNSRAWLTKVGGRR
jgi:hypothetical protein